MSQPPKKKARAEKDGRARKRLPPKPMIPKSSKIAHMHTPIKELTAQQRCELIAEVSEAVLEDPQSAFTSNKLLSATAGDDAENGTATANLHLQSHSKMRRLLELANPSKNDNDESTSRLALLSLLAIFQDILPSYRIRLPTAAEMSVRVSKDTKKLWDYERSLLTSYQQYLKLLEQLWERCSKHLKKQQKHQKHLQTPPSVLSVTAILCLCELLKSAPHFNFRSNILSVVVRQMNNRQLQEVSTACCNAISHLFQTDSQGDIALEAVRIISKMVKERNNNTNGSISIQPQVLRTFLSLPLRVHEDEAQAAKLAEQAKSKKRRKDDNAKEMSEIEKDMKEGDATVDKILLARSQSDTLHAITITYFRILKSVDAGTEGGQGANMIPKNIVDLLPPALEGLAKIGHLINIDTVVDLLAVLKGLLQQVDRLPVDASLNCILTAFQTLQGPGREMQIDQKEYVTPLYSQLPRLTTDGNSAEHTEIAIKCLTAAFLKRREYSTVRVAAFIKQISTTALHAPPFTSAPLLAFVRQLLHRYPSASSVLLENEQDAITSGAYDPNVDDPEHANPFATSAWELATLQFHVNPTVAKHATNASVQKMLQLPMEDPARIRADMIANARECYIAHRVSKKRHPLAPPPTGGRFDYDKKKRNRHQIRFIKPRKTENHHLKELII